MLTENGAGRSQSRIGRSKVSTSMLVFQIFYSASSSTVFNSIKRQVSELGAYRVLVEQAYDLISAHSMDDRALFLFASEAFQRLLGINPQVG